VRSRDGIELRWGEEGVASSVVVEAIGIVDGEDQMALHREEDPAGSRMILHMLADDEAHDRRQVVPEKCHEDPSLAVAHQCFWALHPAKAYAWELRLQDEIRPDFTLDEPGSDAARATFLAEQEREAAEIVAHEHKRRARKAAKADDSGSGPLFDHADGSDAESDADSDSDNGEDAEADADESGDD
jgi:hypothetical protein